MGLNDRSAIIVNITVLFHVKLFFLKKLTQNIYFETTLN